MTWVSDRSTECTAFGLLPTHIGLPEGSRIIGRYNPGDRFSIGGVWHLSSNTGVTQESHYGFTEYDDNKRHATNGTVQNWCERE